MAEKNLSPKFRVGQKVKTPTGEVSKVVSLSFVNGKWFYTVESTEVDLAAKKLIKGVRHYEEAELEVYKGK